MTPGRLYVPEHKKQVQAVSIDIAMTLQRFRNTLDWYGSVPLEDHLNRAEDELEKLRRHVRRLRNMHKHYHGEPASIDDERPSKGGDHG